MQTFKVIKIEFENKTGIRSFVFTGDMIVGDQLPVFNSIPIELRNCIYFDCDVSELDLINLAKIKHLFDFNQNCFITLKIAPSPKQFVLHEFSEYLFDVDLSGPGFQQSQNALVRVSVSPGEFHEEAIEFWSNAISDYYGDIEFPKVRLIDNKKY